MQANSVVPLILVIQVTLVTPVIPVTLVRFRIRLQNLKSGLQNLNLDFPLKCNPSLTCHSCHLTIMVKSLGALAFLGHFPIHTSPILLLPSPHKQGGTTRKFQKGCTVLLGNPDKKCDYCVTVPRTFVHDCSYPSHPTHPSPLYIPVTSHPNHPKNPYYFSHCSYPTHPS